MMGPSFVAHCRQKAAEELEAEFREDNCINADDTEGKGFRLQAEGLWRKKFGNFLKYIPGVGSREEVKNLVEDQDGKDCYGPDRHANGVEDTKLFHSSATRHDQDLEEVLLEFDTLYMK